MSEYIKKPYTEEEMNQKVEELRTRFTKKIDKWADRIVVSMAFTPVIKRVEGETWKENDKTWVMKNGIKMTLCTTQNAKMPWWCPQCSKPMNHRFDRKIWSIRGVCFNCNIDNEGKMRLDGTWEQFERNMVRANEIAYLKDKIQECQDYICNFSTPKVYFEDGRYEELAPLSSFEILLNKLTNDIEIMLNRLEEIKQQEENENAVV